MSKSETADLPERYIRLAHRQYEQDQERNAFFDGIYRELFSKAVLQERNFINLGPGSFWHKFWRTADRLYEGKTWSEQRNRGYEMRIDLAWNLIENTRVDVPDASVEVCYCSHLIEHGWNENVLFFFEEVHRILKPGGVFRITCPDSALGVRALRRKDRFYYPKQANRPTSYMLLQDTSLVTHPENKFSLRPDAADEFLAGFDDVYKALDEASRLSDRELQNTIGAHVNWFTVPKITKFLKQVGFERIYQNGYAQSIMPILRDVRFFDKTDPHMSCYIDVVKT
jgi:SAM-dependent methyltransferase